MNRIEAISNSVTLYLGDCLDIAVERDRSQVYGILTDPPYSSGGFQETGKNSGSIGTRQDDTIALDNLSTRGSEAPCSRGLPNMSTHVVRYITHDAVPDYERNGWKVTWYGWRGDGMACFIASFRCCGLHA